MPLKEKPFKAHQNIPELFVAIMEHDLIRPEPPPPHSINEINFRRWRQYMAELLEWKERHGELIKAAENMLRWNHNKGQ